MKSRIFISLIFFSLLFVACRSENSSSASSGKNVKELTNAAFKKLIFNYGPGKAWENTSGKPVIIDFYADWCVPCRKMGPIIEELASEYAGQIVVYKVDIDKERELAENMRITSIPAFMFIPAKGKPVFSRGIAPKEDLIKVINDILLTKQ
jgi:thioredoxin 1